MGQAGGAVGWVVSVLDTSAQTKVPTPLLFSSGRHIVLHILRCLKHGSG